MPMSRIVVDEMPEYEWECPFYDDTWENPHCRLDESMCTYFLQNRDPIECGRLVPLKEVNANE